MESNNSRRFQATLTNLGLSLLSLALTAILVEVVFRFVVLRRPAVKWNDRPKYFYRPLGARNLQGQRYAVPKPEGVFRISVVGDSISFGPNLQIEDLFSERLQRMLNTKESGLKAEVVNFGVPGYSTADEIKTTRQAVKIDSDLIILQLTLNDPEREPLGGEKAKMFGPYSPPPRLAWILTHWKSLRYVLERLHYSRTHRLYLEYFSNLFDDPAIWGSFERAAGKIIAMAKEKNVPLIPVIFPVFGGTLEKGKYPFYRLHRKFHHFFAERGIDSIDLLSIYDNIPVQRLQVIPGNHGDIHPNEIAHRMAAETIYHYLHRRDLIPDELKISRKYRRRTSQYSKGEPFR